MQAQDKMLAQFHEAEKLEKEKDTMKNKPSYTKVLQMVAKVFHQNDPSCSLSFHQGVTVSFSEFKKHTSGIGCNLLTKMGYDGKGLGINGQVIPNPIQEEAIPRYAGLGYGK